MIKSFKQWAVIGLWVVAFMVAGFVPSQAEPKKIAVAINSEYDFGSYPFPGIFTIRVDGAVVASGTVLMEVGGNPKAPIFHCLYTFVSTAGLVGTLIIKEECVFSMDPDQGRWSVVSGTGDFAEVKGNGSALMPGNQENWVGFFY